MKNVFELKSEEKGNMVFMVKLKKNSTNGKNLGRR